MRPIIVIAGPTASGKSQLALNLAKEIDGVIINADSRQIYKEIKIGTARPDDADFDNIPHYLYGQVSIKDNYNLFKYQQDVYHILQEVPKTKTIILVGGTGLYIDSVVYNYKLKEKAVNPKEREKLLSLSIEELLNKVPSSTLKILNNSERNNPRRLIRIIEKGEQIPNKGISYPNRYFVIDLPNSQLEKNVRQRIETMITNGLIEENKTIREEKLERYQAFDSIGYIEFNGYFEGQKNIDMVKEEIFINTMKYIKRQKTWFKRNKDAIWTNEYDLILKESRSLLKNVSSK